MTTAPSAVNGHVELRAFDPTRPSLRDVTDAIARNRDDYLAAFTLLYESYVTKRLIQRNPYMIRVTPYHLLPTTNVFIAFVRGKVICTVTLIGDGDLGLPMESIYFEEVESARRQGLYVGEVSGLAVPNLEFRSFLPIFVNLTRLMAQFARANGMHQFLIATHPKHARFYQRFMGFKQIGEEREYPTVCDTRGVACCLDFDEIDRNRPACYEQYFGTPIPRHELRSESIPGKFCNGAEVLDFSLGRRLQTVT